MEPKLPRWGGACMQHKLFRPQPVIVNPINNKFLGSLGLSTAGHFQIQPHHTAHMTMAPSTGRRPAPSKQQLEERTVSHLIRDVAAPSRSVLT